MSTFSRRKFIGLTAASVGAAVATSCTRSSDEAPGETQIQQGQIVEAPKTTPVLVETDVLVLGGGPAGMSAALAAAREGVDTTLVERYGAFGGVITQQTMGSIAWYRFAETVDAGGLRGEFEARAKEMGASLDVFGEFKSDLISEDMLESFYAYLDEAGLRKDGKPTYEILETELFKHVADVMLQEAGVLPVLHCWAVDTIMDGDTIRGVITESKSGRQAILAKRVIDCTGDADVAALAGAPFRQSPKAELMECTVNYGLSGVNLEQVLLYLVGQSGGLGDWTETGEGTSSMLTPRVVEAFEKAKAAGEIPEEEEVAYAAYLGAYTDVGEVPDMNTVHLTGVDPTDVWDLTTAEMKSRERINWAIAALKKYTPGFKDARMRTLSPCIGIRESRKILGAYELTEQDIRNEARFEDSIGICPEFIDGYGIIILPTTGRYFHVPFGIILPQKIENLLVAGRSVAGDRISHAATRGMACCCVTGQGAGIAAAVSIKAGVTCREVDIAAVQERLQAQNVRIS